MTLEQLRGMQRRAATWFKKKGTRSFNDITIAELISGFVDVLVKKEGKHCYMELVAPQEQKPAYTVSVAFSMKVTELMEALEWHAEARRLPDSSTYWLSCMATVQKEADDYIAKHNKPPLIAALEWAEGLVCVLDSQARLLTRSLPMMELHAAIKNKKFMDLACPTGTLATVRPFAEGWEFGNFDYNIAEVMLNYNVTECQGMKHGNVNHVEMAKCNIAGVEYQEGKTAPLYDPKYEVFNERLRSKAIGPLLREAAYCGNVRKVDEVIKKKTGKVGLNSPSLRGHTGEMALHAAAAKGHVHIVQSLLLEQANPNVQDSDGETPLHYAALGGQAPIVQVLLRMAADVLVESYFGETPSELAKGYPTRFLHDVSKEGITAAKAELDHAEKTHANDRLQEDLRRLEADNEVLRRRVEVAAR
jgi:ankyrin repeat protein